MKKVILIIAATLALASCSRTDGWTLQGDAPEGVDSVYLRAPTRFGTWYDLDSAKVSNGKYRFQEKRANGTIYAVTLGESTVYVPADSTETITLTADGKRSGSEEALLFNKVEQLVADNADSRALLETLDGKYASTVAYWATRLVKDRRLLRVVANRYKEERPNDPRTTILLAELEKMMPKNSAAPAETQVILAEEIGYYDIELMDRNGEMRKLSESVESNPIVVLAYVDFTNDDTPAITRAIGDVRIAGAAIYEIGFAENQHLWALASESLSWVNVYQSDAANRDHIGRYAVGRFPTFFIIKNGEIVERLNDHTQLAEKVKSLK